MNFFTKPFTPSGQAEGMLWRIMRLAGGSPGLHAVQLAGDRPNLAG
jgi:hypothetical protein